MLNSMGNKCRDCMNYLTSYTFCEDKEIRDPYDQCEDFEPRLKKHIRILGTTIRFLTI